MRVINAVFSKANGGLEQASMDYADALKLSGHDVSFLIRNQCPFQQQVEALNLPVMVQPNRFGKRDIFAIQRIRRYLKAQQPDAVVAHGNRAIHFLSKAAKGICPLIAVNHTTSVLPSLKADAAIVVNEEQKTQLVNAGGDGENIHYLPNMVRVEEQHRNAIIPAQPHQPPVIGCLARFSPEKGVNVFIDALSLLKQMGVAFEARIGGSGPCEQNLKQQVKKLGLTNEVIFMGWVSDRASFYGGLDVVSMPSLAETFGIVMLEAMLHKRPLVSSTTHGARQLAAGYDVAEFTEAGNAQDLARGIQTTLQDWPKSMARAQAGFDMVAQKYDIQTVAKQLDNVLCKIAANG